MKRRLDGTQGSSPASHPDTGRYRLRLRAIRTLVGGLATVGGAVVGFVVTLAIIVAKARAGAYIFAMEDLAAFRWELLPILLGAVAGPLSMTSET